MLVTRTVLAGLLLLSLGCRDAFMSRRSTALPESADLQRFEGKWYDLTGTLIGVIHAGRNPRLDLWVTEGYGPHTLENAQVRYDEILFGLRSASLSEPFPLALKLVDEDRAVVDEFQREPGSIVFLCGGTGLIFPTDLVRNPSPEWLARARAQRVADAATEIGREVHEGVFDWLARKL